MDKNTYKILKFFNSHPKDVFSISEIAKSYPNISTRDIREMVLLLRENGYLRFVGDAQFQATNKGKTYKNVNRTKWISKNIIAILALIVSVIALFRTF